MIVVMFCRVTISPVGSSLVICQGVLWLWQEVRLVLPLSAPVSSCHRRQQWKLKLFSSINSLVASLGLCPTLSLTSHNRDSPQNLLLSSLWHGGSSAANPLKINNINKISFLFSIIPSDGKIRSLCSARSPDSYSSYFQIFLIQQLKKFHWLVTEKNWLKQKNIFQYLTLFKS